MPTPNAYFRLVDQYEALRRAAFDLCMSDAIKHDHPAYDALWDLCADYEPPNEYPECGRTDPHSHAR